MAEPITTAGIIGILVITGAKLALSVATRIKKSKCTDSRGAGITVEFSSGEESETPTPPRHRSRSRSRSQSKKHKHKRRHRHTTTTSTE